MLNQTNRDLGVLRSQIGTEALDTVVEFLRTQYSNRMLNSKAARSRYILKILESKQHPFIWEYFQPGTIEIPRGKETYYDEVSANFTSLHLRAESTHQKRCGAFQSIPVLRAFSVFYTSYGIPGQIPTGDPGIENRPVGALALAAAAVCRSTSKPAS